MSERQHFENDSSIESILFCQSFEKIKFLVSVVMKDNN
jgi:hypothetical protein